MTNPLIITLPATEENLLDEIEQGLLPHASIIRQPPVAFDLEAVKLVIEVVGGTVGIAANVASILTFLLAVKDRAIRSGKPSGIKIGSLGTQGMPLEQADEALLRQLLGLE